MAREKKKTVKKEQESPEEVALDQTQPLAISKRVGGFKIKNLSRHRICFGLQVIDINDVKLINIDCERTQKQIDRAVELRLVGYAD